MIKGLLAVILARGGSKRLPNKNILDFYGKPLISWTIEAALSSNFVDEVIVSSDSDMILDIASKYGVSIIKRPVELSSDNATSIDALIHAVKNHKQYANIVLLQPTSPLRTSAHIDEAMKLLLNKKAKAVVSVCEAEHSPLWCNVLPPDGKMAAFLRTEVIGKRSQDLPQYFRLNGSIYILDTYQFLNKKEISFNEDTYSYSMSVEDSIDIDTIIDFKLAEIIKEMKLNNAE